MAFKVIKCPQCGSDCGAESEDTEIKCENPQCPVKIFKIFEK